MMLYWEIVKNIWIYARPVEIVIFSDNAKKTMLIFQNNEHLRMKNLTLQFLDHSIY